MPLVNLWLFLRPARQKWWPSPPPPFFPFRLSACFAGKWGPFVGEDFSWGGGLSAQMLVPLYKNPRPPSATPHWKNPSYATVPQFSSNSNKGWHYPKVKMCKTCFLRCKESSSTKSLWLGLSAMLPLKGNFPQTTMWIGWVDSNFTNPTVKFGANLDNPFERTNYAKFCMSPSLDGTMPESAIS